MAENKIFAGPRLRRMRNALGLAQADMAQRLGISASYLNLIERNQRPLTVQVLLKLSLAFDVDIAELQADSGGETLTALRAVFADPLLSAELPAPGELSEAVEATPNLARGIVSLYDAYRETATRLSELSASLADGDQAFNDAAARLPFDRVAAWFEEAGPWFSELELEAGELAERLTPRDDIAQALKSHLRESLGIDTRILPAKSMPGERARFDRHSMRLFISERVLLEDRARHMAYQIATTGHGALFETLARQAGLDDAEALRLLRAAFARRFADALILPADRLEAAAFDTGFDLELLAQRFQTRGIRVMARLAVLGGRSGSRVGECALLVADQTGSIIRRVRGGGFPSSRSGAPCGVLPLFDEGGPARAARLEMPDGTGFMALSTKAPTLPGAGAPQIVAMLVWPEAEAPELGHSVEPARAIGVTCRMCEREGCAKRIFPPATRPAAFPDYVLGIAEHEIP